MLYYIFDTAFFRLAETPWNYLVRYISILLLAVFYKFCFDRPIQDLQFLLSNSFFSYQVQKLDFRVFILQLKNTFFLDESLNQSEKLVCTILIIIFIYKESHSLSSNNKNFRTKKEVMIQNTKNEKWTE